MKSGLAYIMFALMRNEIYSVARLSFVLQISRLLFYQNRAANG